MRNSRIGKIPTSPELGKIPSNQGAKAGAMPPRQFGDPMRLERERWTKVCTKPILLRHPRLSSPGIAVRRTASLPLAYDWAIQ
jgi:hypothetical protein